MELVHIHESLVLFLAVARPSYIELQGGSTIAIAAVSQDRLNDCRRTLARCVERHSADWCG